MPVKELNIKMDYKKSFLWVLPFITTITFINTTYGQPIYYTKNIYSIPDLTQTDKKANFPKGGGQYCLPAAISNSFMWFDSNGFSNLVQNTGDLFSDQVKLVNLLASKSYMNTSLEYGTGTTNLIRGVRKYIKERGYEIEQLEYQGWRKHPEEIPWSSSIPQLDWIKQGILGNGTVWMNVGWYKYNAKEDKYARIAGHWVTLAGYGKDEKGQVDPNILIIHDPSPRAGMKFSNEFILASEIHSGTLTGDWVGLPRSAAGYYKFTEGMHIKQGADFAILDGAVVLKLKGPTQTNGDQQSALSDKSKPEWEKSIIEHVGKGCVSRDKPKPGEFSPNMDLSKAERIENFDILWEAIDKYYSFFEHKKIDWQEVRARYRPKVEAVRTTKEFYNLLYQFVRELKDFHSWIDNYEEDLTLPESCPQLSTRLIERKAVVTEVDKDSEAYKEGIRRGSIILEVSGLKAEEKVESLRPQIRMYSSERAFLENAYRQILHGKKGSKVKLRFLPQDGKSPKTAVLTRVQSKSERPKEPNFRVDKGNFIWYGTHPSGLGYIRILSFNGRLEIADEFDLALEKLKDTPGLIIDIRENTGGFGTAQERIIGRFITQRTKVDIAYTKNGAGHKDFKKEETYFVPTGDWQYTRPIALLMNAITGSACDLFACRMISTGKPVTIGATTGGNLTGQGVYVVLPCNLVVRVSNGYICDASGRIIEGNGNVPQIPIEPTIDDIVNGNDPVLMQAVQTLRQVR
jgi:C-terminal processing protease CtpA/Prc